jgi:hypothetical protein
MSNEEFQSLSKQVFHLNIYNALILYKMAEVATFKPMALFDLKNESSWQALEHNVWIWINNQRQTAFEIKDKMLKMKDSHLDKYVRFAFFLPKGGNLPLHDLVYDNVFTFQSNLWRVVGKYIRTKININYKYSLILLPECVKPLLPVLAINPSESKEKKARINQDFVQKALQIVQQLDSEGKFGDIGEIIKQIRKQYDERQVTSIQREWVIEF